MTNRCNFPGAFHSGRHWVNVFVPVQQAPVPAIICRDIVIMVPADPALVLSIMYGENGWHIRKVAAKSMAMPYHKRNEPGMMIVAMNNVGCMLPFGEPVAEGYLESDESFIV